MLWNLYFLYFYVQHQIFHMLVYEFHHFLNVRVYNHLKGGATIFLTVATTSRVLVVAPSQDASGKCRFRLISPKLKMELAPCLVTMQS